MGNCRVELTTRDQAQAEIKINRGIFQEDLFSPLLFIIAMTPSHNLLRKCTGAYKFTKLQEQINHLMYMDDLKVFVKNEKKTWSA